MTMATAETPTQKSPQKFSKENIEKITSEPEGAKGILKLELSGNVTIELEFESEVEAGNHTLTAIGQAKHKEKPYRVTFGEIIRLLDADANLPEALKSLALDLNYILFNYASGKAEGRKWLVGVDLSLVAPDLSSIPLLGSLVEDLHLKIVDDLLLVYSSAAVSKKDIDALNKKLPKDQPKISIPEGAKDTAQILHKGINVSGHLACSATPGLVLPGPTSAEKGGEGESGQSDSKGDGEDLDLKLWFKVQKKLGPLSIDKVGVGFDLKNLELDFMLDGGLDVGGFSLHLQDFSIGSPLTHFEPKVDIRGIAIAYTNPQIELAGALVKLVSKDEHGEDYTEYVGEVKAAVGDDITVLALGGYANYMDHPSMFGYGFLGIPIPIAPTDFEIDGFALGFGYNQAIHAPMANEVDKFPLVAQVMPGAPEPETDVAKKDKKSQAKALIEQFDNLQKFIFPHLGSFFGAAGMKVKGYEMLDLFALAIFEAGSRFELDLMGMGSLTVPVPKTGEGDSNVPALAYIGLSFITSIAFSDGYIGASASITDDSYFLLPDVKPSGGFAAYLWWAGPHSGDFVVSIGGYNPNFDVPEHYPAVSRVLLPCCFFALTAPRITNRGYIALCPHAVMAGIEIEFSYSLWIATASLRFDLDLLLGWKPFYFDASMSVTLRLSAHIWFIHITLEVSASLRFWGPIFDVLPYAQTFEIHAGPFKLSVTNPPWASPDSSGPQPIEWAEFKASFLPKAEDAVCPVRVNQGLVSEVKRSDGTTLPILNPTHLRITVESMVPLGKSGIGDASPGPVANANTNFGIAPMGIRFGDLHTVQTIKVTRDGDPVEDAFAFNPILRRFPWGMWGDSLTPELNGPRFIENALAGFTIVPKQPPKPGETHDLKVGTLQYDPTTVHYQLHELQSFEQLYPSSDEATLLREMGF